LFFVYHPIKIFIVSRTVARNVLNYLTAWTVRWKIWPSIGAAAVIMYGSHYNKLHTNIFRVFRHLMMVFKFYFSHNLNDNILKHVILYIRIRSWYPKPFVGVGGWTMAWGCGRSLLDLYIIFNDLPTVSSELPLQAGISYTLPFTTQFDPLIVKEWVVVL